VCFRAGVQKSESCHEGDFNFLPAVVGLLCNVFIWPSHLMLQLNCDSKPIMIGMECHQIQETRACIIIESTVTLITSVESQKGAIAILEVLRYRCHNEKLSVHCLMTIYELFFKKYSMIEIKKALSLLVIVTHSHCLFECDLRRIMFLQWYLSGPQLP